MIRPDGRQPPTEAAPRRFRWPGQPRSEASHRLLVAETACGATLGKRRLQFTDDQRRRLAAKGKPLRRRAIERFTTIVNTSHDLRWHRRLIAAHHTYPHKSRAVRPGHCEGRPRIDRAHGQGQPGWGDLRIQGELKKVGHRAARTTIAKSLNDHGGPPSTQRFLGVCEDIDTTVSVTRCAPRVFSRRA